MRRFISWIIILILIGISCVGCTTTQLDLPGDETCVAEAEKEATSEITFDKNYYDEYSPAEYVFFLKEVFSTLLPLIPDHSDLGLSSYWEVYGMDDKNISPEYEKDHIYGSEQDSFSYASTIPVFYGLLRETETYLQTKGLTYDDLAVQYGKTHAIKTSDLSAMAELLLRKPVVLAFESVAGAEYISEENIFVYDRLLDPFSEYRERGWSLEFAESDLQLSGKIEWGDDYIPGFMGPMFWYDSDTATLYHPTGEKMGFTHNIDGLREEAGDVFYWCRNTSRAKDPFYYTVAVCYSGIPDKDTPIHSIRVGSMIMGGVEGAVQYLPDGVMSTADLVELESTFFDDYYRSTNLEEKVTNYFTTCFYDRPENFDPSVLPAEDPTQIEEWCLRYLGVVPDGVIDDQADAPMETCPYLAFSSGEINGDIYSLRYYNETQKTYAILTLKKADDSFLFVSNIPVL